MRPQIGQSEELVHKVTYDPMGSPSLFWWLIGPASIQWTDYDGENVHVIVPTRTRDGMILTYVKSEVDPLGPVIETQVCRSRLRYDEWLLMSPVSHLGLHPVRQCVNLMTKSLHADHVDGIHHKLTQELVRFFEPCYNE